MALHIIRCAVVWVFVSWSAAIAAGATFKMKPTLAPVTTVAPSEDGLQLATCLQQYNLCFASPDVNFGWIWQALAR